MQHAKAVELTLDRYPKLIRAVNPTWPIERLQRLVTDWNQGASSNQISSRIQATRSAVVAKVRRLKALGVPMAVHDATPPPPRQKAEHNSQYARAGKSDSKWGRDAQASRPPTAARAAARNHADKILARASKKGPVEGVTFEDLDTHHCRWPNGDPLTKEFRFCGKQRVPSQPYCPSCTAKATPGVQPLDLAAMTLLAEATEDARLSGQPAPFKDPSEALRNFRASLGATIDA